MQLRAAVCAHGYKARPAARDITGINHHRHVGQFDRLRKTGERARVALQDLVGRHMVAALTHPAPNTGKRYAGFVEAHDIQHIR